MIENYKNIGTIDFTKTDKVVIIDPCYDNNDIPNLGVKLPILKGIYNAYIQIEDCEEWGVRVKNLVIINKKYDLNILENNNEEFNGFACVDSGTMSIFDLREYRKYHSNNPENTELNDEWYNLNVISWCGDTNHYLSKDNGVICSSGYGDGSYPVYSYYNNENNLIGIRVCFIEDEEYE